MMLNTLTEHLELLTTTHTPRSASGRGSGNKLELTGIKKLRELILELAVRGKLVPQNPEDEPASVLVERIAAEKARLIAEGKIKRQKLLPEISTDEKPFDIPARWEWARLGNLCHLENGDRGKNYPNKSLLVDSGVPFVNAGHLQNDRINKSEMTFITQDRYELLNAGKFKNGDILYCLRGSLGKVALVEGFEYGAIASSLVILSPSELIDCQYLLQYFGSPFAAVMVKKYDNGTAQPNLSATDLAKFLVPIASQSEQQRIVAKVDQLMILCDQLEQEETDSIAAHQTLVDAMLTTLTDSKDAAELAENWSLVAEHFDTLFTTEASINRLRQTILQLAVMGRLVSQNPDDEPAARLLERIAAEKAQLVKDCKIKKQKPSTVITEAEQLFPLPEGWTWCRIDHLALHSEAGWSPKCNDTPRTDDHWGVLKVSAVTWGEYRPDQNKQLPDHLAPRAEYEVQPNDFLISRANTADLVARSVVVPETAPEHLMMSDKIIRFAFSSEVSSHYINLYNNCRFARDYYAAVAGGTSSSMKNVSRQQIQSLVIPLPSLVEQQRIQIRVNELMTLCDCLQEQLQQAQTTQQQLAFALVEQTIATHHQPMPPQQQ